MANYDPMRTVRYMAFADLVAERDALAKELSELREAKAAPNVAGSPSCSVCGCLMVPTGRIMPGAAWYCGVCAPTPPAPPFVLGPKTRNALCAINTLDGTFHVARETARLIAEWLRRDDWGAELCSRIERGDWGKE